MYLAVADEEALGTYGARQLIEHELDAVRADYVITESGGIPMPAASGTKLPVHHRGEGRPLVPLAGRGTPGHGSMPFGTDNALVKAAEVVRRLAAFRPRRGSPTAGGGSSRRSSCRPRWRRRSSTPTAFDGDARRSRPGMQKLATPAPTRRSRPRSSTAAPRPTSSPTRSTRARHPDVARADDEPRCAPCSSMRSATSPSRSRSCRSATNSATSSPAATPLWDSMQRADRAFYPDGRLIPMLMAGATDARFFRSAGSVAYGFGLFSAPSRW